MMGQNIAIAADVDKIEWMQPVLVVPVHCLVDITQYEHDAGTGSFIRVRRYDRMQTKRHFIHVAVVLHVVDEIHAKII